MNIRSLLLDNKTVKQTIFKNTFWLGLAEVIIKFLGLILLIYAARILGATEYGKFTFALAFVTLFAIFSDFGLPQIIVREFAKDKDKEKEFSSILGLKILLSIVALILMIAGSFLITSDSIIQKVILILSIYIVVNTFARIFYVFLRARQLMQYEALSTILQAVALGGIGFFVIFNFPSVQNLSYSYLFSGILALLFISLFFHFKVYPITFSFKKRIWKEFLSMSWPLAFVVIFSTIYNQIDSTMMGYLGQITQTGWYNAAYRIVKGVLTLNILLIATLYPVLSIAFKQSKQRLQKVWSSWAGVAICIALPLVAGGVVLAPKIINFAYGPSFSPSILAFQILIITAGITYLNTSLAYVLIVADQQKKNFVITLCGALVNIVLNLILIPKYSLYGAAVATLITMLLMFALYSVFVSKFSTVKILDLRIILFLLAASLSSFFMCFTISHILVYNLNIIFLVLIGAAAYLSFVLIFNKIFKLKLI
jgi:O-antigen/teichoic acid export membrane protein